MRSLVFDAFHFEDDDPETLRRESRKSKARNQWQSRKNTQPRDPVGHAVMDLVSDLYFCLDSLPLCNYSIAVCFCVNIYIYIYIYDYIYMCIYF